MTDDDERDELILALKIFLNCAYPVATEINPRGWTWSEAYLDQAKKNAEQVLASLGSRL
jgi:hypothetical protein